MPQTISEILNAAMALSEAERAELSELLAASLTSPTGTLHPAWGAVARRRADQVASGQVQRIPWDEVRRESQSRLETGTSDG